MGLFAAGQVVVLPFPYSDLSASKLRPVLLLADVGREDWIACQITSNPLSDPRALTIAPDSFRSGGLRQISYLRPGKLFTAHESLFVELLGTLDNAVLVLACNEAIAILQSSASSAST